MPRGRPWTADEDQAIREAAEGNRRKGIARSVHDRGDCLAVGDFEGARQGYSKRLQEVASRIGRTYAATLKRAQRIGAESYSHWDR